MFLRRVSLLCESLVHDVRPSCCAAKQIANQHHARYLYTVGESCASCMRTRTKHVPTGCRSRSRVANSAVVPAGVNATPPWRTMFFGTDQFALEHLKLLNLNRLKGDPKVVSTLDVVVASEKCPVGVYAKKNGLKLLRWPLKTAVDYDVGAVVSFGHLIPANLIDSFPYGIVNVHASILPHWRGASPIMHAILNGDSETGISIIEIRPHHFDIGPLLMQSRYPMPDDCMAGELSSFLADQGSHMLLETFHNLLNLERREHEQDVTGVTYAHKLSPTNAHINWETQSLESIDRQYRALGETFNLRTRWKDTRLRLLDMVSPRDMRVLNITRDLEMAFPSSHICPLPGIVFYHKREKVICIRCKDDWVAFRKITMRKTMAAKDFYNGYLSKNKERGVIFSSESNGLDKYTFRTAAAQIKLKAAVTTMA